jgi:hypothetical protein
MSAEMRCRTETLEDQAAYLASLAEAADESARKVETARLDLEQKLTENYQLEAELRVLATTNGLTGALNRNQFLALPWLRLRRGVEPIWTIVPSQRDVGS